MKQIIQSYRTGDLELVDVPAPSPSPDRVLVRTVASLVSVGTERYMLEMAKKSLVGKAMARPDLVRQVMNKARTEGIGEAYRQAMGRLDDPVPLGYSSAGVVLAAGAGADGFAEGDRVACSGSGYASHAEFVSVPKNLAVKIPEGVSFEAASFVTLGSIALHGVRMAQPALGERVVVLGLGLLGQLAVQILEAAGCRVLGADLDPSKVSLAKEHGAAAGVVIGQEDLAAASYAFSRGVGADAVLVFAATDSNEPIEQAAAAARERGRIVVPGLVGLDLPRKTFFEKELSFVVSRAWGPGLFDPRYEHRGLDYPISLVRWTAERNLAEFLDLAAQKKVWIEPFVTHRFPIERAVEAYEMILEGKERFLGVVLNYPEGASPDRTVFLGAESERATALARTPPAASPRAIADRAPATLHPASADAPDEGAARRGVEGHGPRGRDAASGDAAERFAPVSPVRAGFIGAGLFAKGTLLPALKGVRGYELRTLATASGASGHHVGRKFGFKSCTTRTSEVFEDPDIDLVFVLTRHGSHARLVRQALEAGKHVFVEKPLALTEEQLEEVERAYRDSPGQLMVGFNRRFAPTTVAALRLLEALPGPLVVTIRVNAGYAPPESWVHDPDDGGGRIVGEACHFVDLAQALTRSLPISVSAQSVRAPEGSIVEPDNVSITLQMANGGLATIVYAAGGDKAFSRERVEVFGGGAACVIDNFRTMEWTRGGRRVRCGGRLSGVDRGYRAEMETLVRCLERGTPFPVRFEEYAATTRATFAALESLRSRRPVSVLPPGGSAPPV